MARFSIVITLIACVGCAGRQPLPGRSLTTTDRNPAAATAAKSISQQPSAKPATVTTAVAAGSTETTFGELQRSAPEDTSLHQATPLILTAATETVADSEPREIQNAVSPNPTIELNLPSALAMVDGRHPAVGFAQWRVQEAYAQLQRADVLWLPSLQAGVSFHRHDGHYQASDGSIVDVNRNSLQLGLGTGATGAGTTPRPGLVAQFHLADAIFQPQIVRKTAWARGHAAAAVTNQQLLTAALAYLDLLNAHQDVRILEDSRNRLSQLSQLTSDFAEAGQGLRADAERMQTELNLVDSRLVRAREQAAVASARLAQALSLDARQPIQPLDITVLPLELVSPGVDQDALISTGLATRPELKESQALVAAACEAYRREAYAPFVPSVLLGLSAGGFGGGLGSSPDNVDGRYDFDALMSWEIRNLGFGERAARRESSARYQQSRFEQIRLMDQVAREVSEAASQVHFRRQQTSITQQAIQSAENSYELNLARIRDGQGLPLEVLQSVQALETARQAYLATVVDYNQAQFRLQWALGWPVTAAATTASELQSATDTPHELPTPPTTQAPLAQLALNDRG